MNNQELIPKKPWVLISVFKENTNPDDLARITPQIQVRSEQIL